MIKIKERSPNLYGRAFDYELEDGTLLEPNHWNGREYVLGHSAYCPVYMYQAEGISLESLEKGSPAWNEAVRVIWFERR